MEKIYKSEICENCSKKGTCNCGGKILKIISGKRTLEHSEITTWICEEKYYGRRNKKNSINSRCM